MSTRITPSQVRAGRAMLQLTQGELGDRVGMSRQSIEAFEKKDEVEGRVTPKNNEALVAFFRAEGVELIEPGPRWGAGMMWAKNPELENG